jgi:hypothetical protein
MFSDRDLNQIKKSAPLLGIIADIFILQGETDLLYEYLKYTAEGQFILEIKLRINSEDCKRTINE